MSKQGRSASSVAPARVQAPAAPSGDASRTVRVPWSASSVSLVRRTLVQDLRSRGVATVTVDESEIVVSELVSNACRHGSGRIELRVHSDADGVEASVHDEGVAQTIASPVPRPERGGWGLLLVDRLADSWGVEDGASRVWFTVAA